MRKGAVEIPITWIYILIVGGIVIFLFARIGIVIFQVSDEANAQVVATYFNDVVESLAETSGQMGTTEFKVNLQLRVGEDGLSRVVYKDQSQLVKTYVFSERQLRGEVSYWSAPFTVGYTGANMLLLADRSRDYIFIVDDPRLIPFMEDVLPFNYGSVLGISIEEHTTFITASPASYTKPKITCIQLTDGAIYPDADPDRSIDGDPESRSCDVAHTLDIDPVFLAAGVVSYPVEIIYAQAFAYDAESFERAYRTMMQRHRITGEILRERIGDSSKGLYAQYTLSACQTRYDDALVPLNVLRNPFPPHNSENDVIIAINDMTRINRELASNCERVY